MTTPIPAGWKPISSAPKDGTDIFLTNGVDVSCGHWHYDEGGTTEFRDLDGRYIGQDDHDGFAGWLDWMGGMTPNPTHWMPLPAAPGTPAASAQDDAKDERQAFEAWAGNKGWPLSPYQNNCGIVVAERYGHRTVQKAWEAWQERASAPAAGDALDAKRYRWLRDQTETDGIAIVMKNKHFDASRTCAENIDKLIDAALAAQVPQQGEA